MSKPLPLIFIHRLFLVAALLIVALFCAFITYLYVSFNGPLTGDITTEPRPDLLTNLDSAKFKRSLGRMDARAALEDIPTDLPDPYKPVTPQGP